MALSKKGRVDGTRIPPVSRYVYYNSKESEFVRIPNTKFFLTAHCRQMSNSEISTSQVFKFHYNSYFHHFISNPNPSNHIQLTLVKSIHPDQIRSAGSKNMSDLSYLGLYRRIQNKLLHPTFNFATTRTHIRGPGHISEDPDTYPRNRTHIRRPGHIADYQDQNKIISTTQATKSARSTSPTIYIFEVLNIYKF